MYDFKKLIKSAFALVMALTLSLLAACSSSDPTIVNADFSAQGVKGKIEGDIVVIDLSDLGNCATTIENMTIAAETFGASVSPDPRVARDYTNPVDFTITAPDGTKAVFKVKVKGAGCLGTPAPVANTPLTIGQITCTNNNAVYPDSFEMDTTVCSVDVVDPDGIQSVTIRSTDNLHPELDSIFSSVTNSGSTYSVTLSYFEKIRPGSYSIEFVAIGKKPDGSSEAENKSSTDIEICSGFLPQEFAFAAAPIRTQCIEPA
ncbi:MAG TPA: hypothetical protein PKC80_10330 [Burkholderiaceae bacterium]|nr:hypothetical protein [Burkholderiaceae bacterium]